MSRYIIHRTKSFNRVLKSLVKKNNPLLIDFEKAVKSLRVDPFSIRLRSHKVTSKM
jgi:mRNA-degrading endonuclease YafQ of YafQ-DinJ toxin-antitoxin module